MGTDDCTSDTANDSIEEGEEVEIIVRESEEILEDDEQSRNSRKTSDMWKYFTPMDSIQAICKFCDKAFSYRSSTSNLRKHFVKKHAGSSYEWPAKKISYENETSKVPKPTPAVRIRPGEGAIPRRFMESDVSYGEAQLPTWSLSPDKRKPPDEYDAFAFRIATKLRKMEESQRLYCERIINEALYKGAVKELDLNSAIVCRITGI